MNFKLSWKCRRFRCRPQLVLKTRLRVFPTQRPDTADVSVISCDVRFFCSVSYVMSLPNCRHVMVVTATTYHTHLVYLICFTPHPRLNTKPSQLFCQLPSRPCCCHQTSNTISSFFTVGQRMISLATGVCAWAM